MCMSNDETQNIKHTDTQHVMFKNICNWLNENALTYTFNIIYEIFKYIHMNNV